MATLSIELYGIARRRAGRPSIDVVASTLGEALAALERASPPLSGEIVSDGRLAPHWVISLDGTRFLDDATFALEDGMRLMLLSSLAGG